MAVRIAKPASVLLLRAVEGGTKIKILQIGREDTLPIVVIYLPLVKHGVANTQIEHTGIAAARTAALNDRDVAPALRIGEHLHHGPVDNKAVEVPLFMQDGDNTHAHRGVCYLQQRRIRIRRSAVDSQSVGIETKIRKVERK